MRDLERQIHMAVLLNENMSLSEIQSSFLNTSQRTIIRSVNELVKSGELEHKRILRKGKRKRYTVKEEKIENDITMRAFPEEVMHGNKSAEEILSLQIRPKITQRDLSKLITAHMRSYNQQIRDMKQFGETQGYYFYHSAIISDCLEWITRLTFAMNSQMLGNSSIKLELAKRNRERYEEFLERLCNNIKKYDEKKGEKMIREIYHELTNVWFMEKLLDKLIRR
jgi:hypothetical protein